jgi:hypothetical protein
MKIRDQFGAIVVDRKTILKCIVKTYGIRVWNGFIWLRIAASSVLVNME